MNKYIAPETEIIQFETEDVITTSGPSIGPIELPIQPAN